MTHLLIDHSTPKLALLRLNRPERRNALSTDLLRQIAQALIDADRDPTIACAIITGNEKIFAAGADLAELAEKTAQDGRDDPRIALWASIRDFAKPLVAAVEGWCLGAGCELMMCCDIILAGRGAKFGQPETNLGIMPGAGGTATLARLVSRPLAMKMVLLGEPISAMDAKEAGLITDIVEDGAALTASLALAKTLATRAPLALRQAKASVKAAFDLTHQSHLAHEREIFCTLLDSEDKSEGIKAFIEKRPPQWRGR